MTTFTNAPLFLSALAVGLSIAAPVGPIGLLTIQRTLHQGFGAGLATGLGAATADSLYGAVGAFGVTWAIAWLTGLKLPLALVGGALLLWLAWQTWRAPLAARSATAGGGNLWGMFGGTLVLTLSNPATILSFIAIFGALGGSMAGQASPWVMVAGVWVGSALWWLMLAGVVSRTRHQFSDAWRLRINTGSALFLAAFALWQWAMVLRGLI